MENIDKFITRFGGVTESYKFYNNTIELRYDVKNHVYLLVTSEGLIPQEGVTSVVHIVDKSNVLIPWACKMMAQKLKITMEPYLEKEHYVGGSLFGNKYEIMQPDFDNLLSEAKTAHKDKLEDAGEVGHAAHGWIEAHIKDLVSNRYEDGQPIENIPQKDFRVTNCIVAALTWMANHNVRWIYTEKKVYSRDYQYAGTMDGLAKVDSCNNLECCPVPFKNKLSLIDWKTSNYLYIEFILQTAAYKQAYEEEFGTCIEDIWVIRLGKEDGEFQAWHVPSFIQNQGWNAFLDALNLSRSMADIEDSLQAIKDEKKAIEKEKEMAEKQERLKVKCKNADKYKGIRKPRCNNGNPCQTCIAKYAETHNDIPYQV